MKDTRGAACLRRAERINGEYILNARNADQKYNNTPPGVEGPIYKRLMQLNENAGGCTKSLVCGAFVLVINYFIQWKKPSSGVKKKN